ncbi:vacuolar-processing enzyme-like [Pyrus ussuriensis x Pyrus communis]|uniref:Vacuolar-processing enzyme-like n=1 Tax=Pyrus ussuriensis x Pyrus communis TaxID=2448454 RepID=A0A5N5H934_9ROSA|nr:vacuolar-processing enzyme-like [Pyrus ussuriensis x Pyrus communis]
MQADICHAYQILKKGGLKDENIIVFMYDDIAYNSENPRKGVIINKPNGPDVYKGVPKDYTGTHVNARNLYAVILGDKSALTGGSGKVLSSGPNDHVFIYYADHGSVGLLGMPSDRVYAKDLISVLQKKNASKGYKSMVFYIEACEAGSMFEGLLSKESSYGTYCPGDLSVPAEFDTCLGDLYSISWMEDCDISDLHKETLENQYQRVRRRTTNSHVMQYGDMSHKQELLFAYMGVDLSNRSLTSTSDISSPSFSRAVNQRDTKLLYLQQKLQRAPTGSQEKQVAQKQLLLEIALRKNVDYSITKLGEVLFGHEKSSNILMNVRPQGQPVVDNWDCFKNFVSSSPLNIYEKYCGHLSAYGMKYTRAIANICNAGITTEKMVAASDQTCA